MSEEKRERSSPYPGATWEEAVDLVKRLSSLGKSVSYSALAADYGVKSVTTVSFATKASSARQFGLISVQNQVATLTEDGRKLVFSTSEEEVARICVKSFCSPALYRKLIDRYEGKAIPAQKVLENILLQDYNIISSAKAVAAQVFLASLEQLGFNKAGVLTLENASVDTNAAPEDDEPVAGDETDSSVQSSPTSPALVQQENQYHRFEIPTLRPGVTAQVLIPAGLSELDLDFVQASFEFMFNRFIDNLKKGGVNMQEIT